MAAGKRTVQILSVGMRWCLSCSAVFSAIVGSSSSGFAAGDEGFAVLSEFAVPYDAADGNTSAVYRPTAPNVLFHDSAGRVVSETTDVEGILQTEGQIQNLPPAPADPEQAVAGGTISQTPPVVETPAAGSVSEGTPERLRDRLEGRLEPDLRWESMQPYSVYRSGESGWGWLPGSGDDFGWLSMQSDTYLPRHAKSGFDLSFSLHWLNGPNTLPLPPRLYDLALGYQRRGDLTTSFGYDIATSVGMFTDFESSVRDGIRFPSHAVGILHANLQTDLVLGVDLPDRDDVTALPVVGVSVRDALIEGLRMDLVFPRPRVEYAVSPDLRLYLAGRLGGGTWDVEFPDSSDQVMTYRDYRLAAGIETPDRNGEISAIELCWITGRRLELRDSPERLQMDDALMLQFVVRR